MNLYRSSTQSRALQWIRFPLAALVVTIHTAVCDNTDDLAYYQNPGQHCSTDILFHFWLSIFNWKGRI